MPTIHLTPPQFKVAVVGQQSLNPLKFGGAMVLDIRNGALSERRTTLVKKTYISPQAGYRTRDIQKLFLTYSRPYTSTLYWPG